jgi:inner membrane protein
MENQSIIDRINSWFRESVTIKLASIGFLVLILLIPSSWITDLMQERQLRAMEVIDEVSDKWSGSQLVAGPILTIPYLRDEVINKGNGVMEVTKVKELAYFLPEELTTEGTIKPQVRSRGLFDAVVYESLLDSKATFVKPDFESLQIQPDRVLWSEARLLFGISDLRGISETPNLMVGGKPLATEPTNDLGVLFGLATRPAGYNSDGQPPVSNGIICRLGWKSADDFQSAVAWQLALKGSTQFFTVPLGKNTQMHLKGPWPDPSFDGEFLPESRTLTETDFDARWKILHFNRPFSQQWTGVNRQLSGSDFGVRLLLPVDQYQKSIRTAKYGVLIVILSFLALFMVEVMKKIRIHPFQYILVGAALIIYYTLLLSLSEQLGYTLAYGLASIATIGLIAAYASTFFKNRPITILYAGLMTFFYAFVFVIIQMQDYSLLLGSVGLFLVVAGIMYFSRNIQWYTEK